MDFLYWQNIDCNNFNIFVRDLSERLNSNVKNIVIDTYNDLEKSKKIIKNTTEPIPTNDLPLDVGALTKTLLFDFKILNVSICQSSKR